MSKASIGSFKPIISVRNLPRSRFEITKSPKEDITVYENLGVDSCNLEEFCARMISCSALPEIPSSHIFDLMPVEEIGLKWFIDDKDYTSRFNWTDVKVLISKPRV